MQFSPNADAATFLSGYRSGLTVAACWCGLVVVVSGAGDNGATTVPPHDCRGRAMAFSGMGRLHGLGAGFGLGPGVGVAGCGVRVTVASSKFTVSPARTVTVPAVEPGVSTPPGVTVQPRSG